MQTWISKHTTDTMKSLACELIDAHAANMNLAFLKAEDGKLKVNLALDVAMSEAVANAVDIAATISYTLERVRDKIEKTGISELQVEISFPKTAAEG